MTRIIFVLYFLFSSIGLGQYQEATITRTTSTNSVFPRQFPSMTIRKMNPNEYWIFESLGTNTIFHRQFPTYIVRRENYGQSHPNQKWGVYRTTSTNSVFPVQFPDRYISSFDGVESSKNENNNTFSNQVKTSYTSMTQQAPVVNSSYTYSKSLRSDKKPSYNPENPE